MQHAYSNYNAFCSMTWLTRVHLRTWHHQLTPIMQPFQCDLQPQVQETQRSMHAGTTTLQNTEEEPIDLEMIQTAPAAHRRYLSHGKTQGFVLRLPPQNEAHATFMQPLQCVLQHDVANPHASTRRHHQMTTIMQPFQCDLQPQVQETQGSTHAGTTTRCRTQRRNRLTSKRSKPHPPHTGDTFHRRLKPLYTEKHKVSCSGSLPKTKHVQHSCSH